MAEIMGIQVCVAGNVGSGKTTLAKVLCRGLGLTYVPQRRPNPSYLNDLFAIPERWAFESQVAFLMAKAASLFSSAAAGLSVVLDRSISEDVQVFARLFHERGQMSNRAYETYLQVASLALRSLPPPTLLIFCSCDAAECENRVLGRGQRDFEKLYPKDHIKHLGQMYEEWLSTFDQCPVFILDTRGSDIRQSEIQREVTEDVRSILRNGILSESVVQLPLFSGSVGSQPNRLQRLIFHKSPVSLHPQRYRLRSKRGVNIPTSPFAYIAAPFTGMSLSEDSEAMLFELPARGQIKPGPYRDALLGIERSLHRYGIQSIVPHRDDSDWGTKPLRPKELVEWCSVQIQHCSLICAIPSSSSGVHYEVGLARAWQKPTIIFESQDGSDSAISRGLYDSWDVLRIQYRSLSDIPIQMRGEECEKFLLRMGLL